MRPSTTPRTIASRTFESDTTTQPSPAPPVRAGHGPQCGAALLEGGREHRHGQGGHSRFGVGREPVANPLARPDQAGRIEELDAARRRRRLRGLALRVQVLHRPGGLLETHSAPRAGCRSSACGSPSHRRTARRTRWSWRPTSRSSVITTGTVGTTSKPASGSSGVPLPARRAPASRPARRSAECSGA